MPSSTTSPIPARLAAAAAAIANARGDRHGAPPVTNVLEILPDDILADVLEDAQAALAAADLAALAPQLRKPRTLTEIDAAALGLDLGARGVLILTLDATSRLAGALWSQGGPAGALHGSALGPVWSSAVATFTATLSQESRR